MTVYAYWGNKHEQLDGTSALIVESGEVMIGYSGDFTDEEFEELSDRYILVQGTVDPDHPIRRLFFPWVREDTISGAVIGGESGGPPTNVTPPDITPSSPSNTSAPVLSGSAQQSATLFTTNGGWQNSPTSFTYQWQKSTNGTSGWTNLSGATTNSYTVQSGDVSDYLRCQVTATNVTGSTTANSGVDGPVTSSTPGVPVNSAAPAITGTVTQGDVLTGSNGSWTNSPTSYAYQWQTSADGSTGWTNLSGATASTYTIQSGDVGNHLRIQVTATNAGGSSSPANSTATSAVASSGGGLTPVSIVQSVNPSGLGGSTFNGVFTNPTTNGNTIVVGIQLYGQGPDVVAHVSGVSDGGTNVFTKATASEKTLDGGLDYGLTTVFYYCENITGVSHHNIAVTADTSSVYPFLMMWELSPSAFDQAGGATGTNPASPSSPADIDAGTLTPSADGAIAFFLGNTAGDPSTSYWNSTGWATPDYLGQGGSGSTITAHRFQSTAAPIDLGMNYSNINQMIWCASGAIFKPAAPTGGGGDSVISVIKLHSSGWTGVGGAPGTFTSSDGASWDDSTPSTSGSTLVFGMRWSGAGAGGSLVSVQDDASGGSNVWVVDSSSVETATDPGGQHIGVAWAYCVNAKPCSVVTYTYTTGDTGTIYYTPCMYEISRSVRDNSSKATGLVTGSSDGSPVDIHPPNITPSKSNGLAFSQAVCSGGDFPSVGSGWTSDFNTSGLAIEHKSLPDTSAVAGDVKVGSDGTYVINQIVFVSA